jgi:hypothetical protein
VQEPVLNVKALILIERAVPAMLYDPALVVTAVTVYP